MAEDRLPPQQSSEDTGQAGRELTQARTVEPVSVSRAEARPVHREPFPDDQVDERGELKPFEFLFRFGLLLGAGLFLHESLGAPWERHLFGVAALLLSALLVSTLALQWRVLGDWRRRTNQALYLVAIFVLTWPIAAALSPNFGASALPDILETPILQIREILENIPGASAALGFLKGLVSFLFLLVVMIMLLFGRGESRRGAVFLATLILTATCLFFYPSAESLVGFVFLFMFFAAQREVPILVPDKLRPHLSRVQLEFLRELVTQGTLSTGETKIYLENDPRLFAELLDYKLVEYNSMMREVLPGPRLLHDPASSTVETGIGMLRRGVWILLGIVYFIMPDIIPGPLDDMIILFLCAGGGTGLMSMLTAKKR